MKSEKWIVVAAKVAGCIGPRNSVVEHPADGNAIYIARVNAETNYASAILIHDNENPMRFEQDGFATKKIDTPQAVFAVTKKR